MAVSPALARALLEVASGGRGPRCPSGVPAALAALGGAGAVAGVGEAAVDAHVVEVDRGREHRQRRPRPHPPVHRPCHPQQCWMGWVGRVRGLGWGAVGQQVSLSAAGVEPLCSVHGRGGFVVALALPQAHPKTPGPAASQQPLRAGRSRSARFVRTREAGGCEGSSGGQGRPNNFHCA